MGQDDIDSKSSRNMTESLSFNVMQPPPTNFGSDPRFSRVAPVRAHPRSELGGFAAAEGIYRSRNHASSIATNFGRNTFPSIGATMGSTVAPHRRREHILFGLRYYLFQ
jgi:hypothetical protein